MADSVKTPLEIIEELVASGTTNITKVGEEVEDGQPIIWTGTLDAFYGETSEVDTRILEAAASDVEFDEWMAGGFAEDGDQA